MESVGTIRGQTYNNIKEKLEKSGDLTNIEWTIHDSVSKCLFSCTLDCYKLKNKDLVMKYLSNLGYKVKLVSGERPFLDVRWE